MTAYARDINEQSQAEDAGVSCPLCGGNLIRPSWLGSIYYKGKGFNYTGCGSCGSVFCNPMPDDEILCEMYGSTHEEDAGVPKPPPAEEAEPDRTARLLMDLKNGTLIDYGCGSGAFLRSAANLGWNVMGVEFDRKRAAEVQRNTGVRVVDKDSEAFRAAVGLADVVHLGDVLEHLTKLELQFPTILNLLKPGGLVVATGPLEGNATIFNLALRCVRLLTCRIRSVENPPRHVILATARGQKALFERFGLTHVEFSTCEVSWPAPARISLSDLRRPRSVALFILSRISRTVKTLAPADWGNRYYYIGQLPGGPLG